MKDHIESFILISFCVFGVYIFTKTIFKPSNFEIINTNNIENNKNITNLPDLNNYEKIANYLNWPIEKVQNLFQKKILLEDGLGKFSTTPKFNIVEDQFLNIYNFFKNSGKIPEYWDVKTFAENLNDIDYYINFANNLELKDSEILEEVWSIYSQNHNTVDYLELELKNHMSSSEMCQIMKAHEVVCEQFDKIIILEETSNNLFFDNWIALLVVSSIIISLSFVIYSYYKSNYKETNLENESISTLIDTSITEKTNPENITFLNEMEVEKHFLFNINEEIISDETIILVNDLLHRL